MNILFISAIVLLFIVFILFSWPRVMLFYIKTTSGRYSPAYLAQHKKFFNKNPFGYCIKEDFIDRILPFINLKENAVFIEISENRLPLKFPWFTTFKKVRMEEGKPVCFQSYRKYGIDFKIIGYKSSIHGTRARVHYYFADRLLFMTEYVITESGGKKPEELIGFLPEERRDIPLSYKYLYADIDEEEKIFCRDAAFSLIIATLNSGHPHIKKCLNRIGEEHKKLWQHLARS